VAATAIPAAQIQAVMQEAVKNCKKVEDDCEIFL